MSLLDGVRVVELGSAITAPLAAMLLADLGADVVKVEPPGGDQFRGGAGVKYGPTFIAYNRNKRGIVLDLATEADRAMLERLIADADVFIDNFRPGVLERLGLAPARLAGAYPRLIHCSITGFGTEGPWANRPAFDTVGQALSGMASLFLDPAAPQPVGPTISDNVTGMYACYGVLGALVERQRTGRGRRIEVNMLEATMAFMGDAFHNHTRTGRNVGRLSRVSGSLSFAFRCADQRLVVIHLSTPEKFWQGLVAAVELPALIADPRFGNHAERRANYPALRALLAERFLAHTAAEWERILAAHDVPSAPVLDVAAAMASAQTAALDSIFSVSHPSEGVIRGIHSPLRIDGERPRGTLTPPPTVGEHTEDVLAPYRAQSDGG